MTSSRRRLTVLNRSSICLVALSLFHSSSLRAESGNNSATYVDVSITQLMSSPAHYDGKKIALQGYVVIEFENHSICMSRESLSPKNCLWISIDSGPFESDKDAERFHLKEKRWSEFNRHVVLIRGIFDKAETGHFGLWFGGIRDVREISSDGKQVTFDIKP